MRPRLVFLLLALGCAQAATPPSTWRSGSRRTTRSPGRASLAASSTKTTTRSSRATAGRMAPDVMVNASSHARSKGSTLMLDAQ